MACLTKTSKPFKLVTVIFITLIISSCYVADAILIDTSINESLQSKSEKSIQTYVKNESPNLRYTSIGFTPLTIHVPREIRELEKWPEYGSDSVKLELENTIKKNNLHRTVHLDHFYTLAQGREFYILENTFVLDETLAVENIIPLLTVVTNDSLEMALNYYMYEYPLFKSYATETNQTVSTEFYQNYKSHYVELATINERSNFLLHTLQIIYLCINSGKFEPDYIAQFFANKNLQKEHGSSYQATGFSSLYEKRTNKDLEGYYIFHKFILKDSIETEKNLKINYSPYFEIETKVEFTE